jgi:hypothetical protein
MSMTEDDKKTAAKLANQLQEIISDTTDNPAIVLAAFACLIGASYAKTNQSYDVLVSDLQALGNNAIGVYQNRRGRVIQ